MLPFRLLAHFSLQWFDWTHYQENILVPPSFHLTQYDRLLVTVYDISTALCPFSVISDVSSAYLVCVHAGESIRRLGIFLSKLDLCCHAEHLKAMYSYIYRYLNWYYARSIFPDQSTLIKNITDGMLYFVDDIFRRSGESECILALHARQVDFEQIPPREILRRGLNWRTIFSETGLALHPPSLTGGSMWVIFPPSANACPCMTFLESRSQLITWTQVLRLDILASIFNKDSNCTKPRD